MPVVGFVFPDPFGGGFIGVFRVADGCSAFGANYTSGGSTLSVDAAPISAGGCFEIEEPADEPEIIPTDLEPAMATYALPAESPVKSALSPVECIYMSTGVRQNQRAVRGFPP